MILSDAEAAFSDAPLLDANGFPIAVPDALSFVSKYGGLLGASAAALIGWYVYKQYHRKTT